MHSKIKDLQLRDEVNLDFDGYATATVVRIDGDNVYLERPYIHTSDFSTASGVISYIGIDRLTLYQGSARTVDVITRHNTR